MPMAAFQLLVKLLLAVPGGELLKIDGGVLWATLVTRECVLVSVERTVQLVYQK